MLHKTKGIVIRSVKYGDTSLVSTIFTAQYGLQTYMVQGVRSSKTKNNKASLLQPATLLDLVVYHKPNTNMQRIKEFQFAYLYHTLQEDIIKNSIALFSVELLLRLLPENAPLPELFDLSFDYFQKLDILTVKEVSNFPLYFVIRCGCILGYELKGGYSAATPHLDLREGGFTEHSPKLPPYLQDEDARLLAELIKIKRIDDLYRTEMNAAMRYRLLDWYIDFLQMHTQHMGSMKSLQVLQSILH
jgi:DNA repair protein RecO (recombination protein O)